MAGPRGFRSSVTSNIIFAQPRVCFTRDGDELERWSCIVCIFFCDDDDDNNMEVDRSRGWQSLSCFLSPLCSNTRARLERWVYLDC